MRIRAAALVLLAPLALTLAACGDDSKGSDTTSSAPTTIKLGYFPNITHATAIVGVDKGIFAKDLGTDKLQTANFNAGNAAVEALFSGAVDATFVGPNPAINAWAKSKEIKIISGATSGGAALVVKPSINSVEDLKGKKLATPSLGNTQDVALRSYLKEHDLKTDTSGGGDVSIIPQENSATLESFTAGNIDGAWVPEPWATRLVQDAGGEILVNEASLWPQGQFVTTHLIVSTKFLDKHPDTVKRLLEGVVEANDWIAANPTEAQTVVNAGIKTITGKALKDAVIAAAWKNLTFTVDPIASSLTKSKDDAISLELLKPVDLAGIYDLEPLNAILKAKGKAEVKGL